MKPTATEKNTAARNIVANLFIRARFAKKLLNRALKTGDEIRINIYTAQWAEAHNAAVTSHRILHGLPY